ncbi:MAG: Na+/H+ antiporter subunit E [Deltaproteobacteria bacterium]|nr:Na+/H+ antiporter subunit E [Deltaproteobacteria bacterium]
MVWSEATISSLIVGAPAIAIGTWLAVRLPRGAPWRLRLRALPGFGIFFVVHSFKGGVEVAIQSLFGSRRIQPGIVRFQTRVEHEPTRLFLAAIIGLLPGTLVAGVESSMLLVHALNTTSDVEANLRVLEGRVARLFGVELSTMSLDSEATP